VNVRLEAERHHPSWRGRGSLPWRSCLPFVRNDKGVLVHRPRRVTTYTHHRKPYISIQYWCGNTCIGSKKFTFLTQPGVDELLCAVCEMKAAAAGQRASDALCGRHVHVGKTVAVRVCCGGVK
jgi:hypothetical protein